METAPVQDTALHLENDIAEILDLQQHRVAGSF
jgi:hypothetical protein